MQPGAVALFDAGQRDQNSSNAAFCPGNQRPLAIDSFVLAKVQRMKAIEQAQYCDRIHEFVTVPTSQDCMMPHDMMDVGSRSFPGNWSPPPAAPSPIPVSGGSACGLDARLHAAQARLSGGLSPIGMSLAFLDWGLHLANAPDRQAELVRFAMEQWWRCVGGTVLPTVADQRFSDPAWQKAPFSHWVQSYLSAAAWWTRATHDVPGLAASNQRIVAFGIKQLVDMASPANIPWLNPEVAEATARTSGQNLVAGTLNLLRDRNKDAEPGNFRVGYELAITPGKVVYRNELIELIQYAPATPKVGSTPVLIVPAWIMKYYILDLTPKNSMIRYLVNQGHTVFAISWRNPDASCAETTLDDYRTRGIMQALDAITDICGARKIQACGYCLGGTLLSIAAATMARDGDDRLASVTLFCAQTDFTEAGELQLFITEDQLAFLGDIMRTKGYLDSGQMAGSFALLRSNEAIWSHIIKSYWLGQPDHPSDLMAWNADGTRMPARMHDAYLHRLFLNNELARGIFPVEGRPITVSDIRVPMFVVGTETDHIAPWRSVYKIALLNQAEQTFVLTSGGHNAGVVSPPGHPHRHFRIATRKAGALYTGPDEWLANAEPMDGSWWPAWSAWLKTHAGENVRPPNMGSAKNEALEDAPGRYVHQQ